MARGRAVRGLVYMWLAAPPMRRGRLTKKFRRWDVEQSWLLPPSVRELVPEDHAAHFVRELMRNDLELNAILDSYVEEGGQPPCHW